MIPLLLESCGEVKHHDKGALGRKLLTRGIQEAKNKNKKKESDCDKAFKIHISSDPQIGHTS